VFWRAKGVKNLKTYILIYDEFVQFEVIFASYFMKTKGEIVTVGLTNEKVSSFEEFITVPHMTIDEIDLNDVDIFIIPGGNPKTLKSNRFDKLLKKLNKKGIPIAAICSAPIHLARSGILKGKSYTTTLPIDEFKIFEKENFINKNVVVDKNIITAKASGYVDFAIEIGKVMNIFENEEDLEETIRYFKRFDQNE
jgi:putative intracellular protease/amidase